MTAVEVPNSVRKMSDTDYLQLLIRSIKTRTIEGVTFPGFPEEAIQSQFVGSSGEHALTEAFYFWQLVKDVTKGTGRPLTDETRVLDFGCGWGRFLRFFWKDVDSKNLYGVDVDPDVIESCRQAGVPGFLSTIEPLGKLPFPDGHFDVVIAYSVFTHLPEHVHRHWLQEISRVTRRGGVAVFTLESKRFLEFVRDEAPKGTHGWHIGLARFAPTIDDAIKNYESGKFIYLPTGGGEHRPSETYGDAAVPLRWIEANWSQWRVEKYIDDQRQFWQAVCALQHS